MGKALPDSTFFHAGQPQAGEGLFAACLLIHQAEDQFSLAPCVRSTDHAVYIRAVHKFLQDTELLFGGRRHQILPLLRQDGQVCDTPLDVFGVVDIGRCQLHQMTNTPADKIAVPFKVAVLTAGGTEDFGVGHGNRGLFCYN